MFLPKTLELTKCKDGYWLYDETRGMNLSMRAATQTDAFIEALAYYQERLLEVEGKYKVLKDKVDAFIESVVPESYENSNPYEY